MPGFANLTDLIDGFHEAALTPELWPTMLARMGEMVGGSGVVVLSAYDPVGGARLLNSAGYNIEYWERVQAEHSSPETNKYMGLVNTARPGQVLQPREHMSVKEWLDDPIHRKFLKPDGLADGLMCPLSQADGGFTAMAMFRGQHYDNTHVRILEAAAPHVRHALNVHVRLQGHAAAAQAGLAALDNVGAGVILVDAHARVVFANAAAERLLRWNDGLLIDRGAVLRTASTRETRHLHHLIQAADEAAGRGRRSAMQTGRPGFAGGTMRVERRRQAGALDVLVTPLRSAKGVARPGYPGPASAMLFVADPDSNVAVELQALRDHYGLSLREARLVLQLLGGDDLRAAAAAMGITLNTARTLLRRSFERTGTNRQQDLLGRILRGPLGLAASFVETGGKDDHDGH